MIVDFENKGPHMNEIEEATYFFASKLLHKRTLDVLDVCIEFERLEGNTAGGCLWQEAQDYILALDPRMPLDQTIETLAHEMIHVKQYAKRELREKPNGQMMWKKQPFDKKGVDYIDLPWEVEAYANERELYESYLEWRKNR